jgi:hypothetical protein
MVKCYSLFNFFYNIDKYIFDENDLFYKDPKNKEFLKKSLYLLYLLICIYLVIIFVCYYFFKTNLF